MRDIIEVKDLCKSYGSVKAIKKISFSVGEGNLFAFLGTNGAGKSTTIDILCTLIKNDEGRVIIDGEELGKNDNKIRSKIGVVFQYGVLDNILTIKENLQVRASFYKLSGRKLKEKMDQIIKICQLEDFINRPYGKLSGGQKRRADIARALIHDPKILFLDEPTTGLDPNTRKSIWDTIVNMQQEMGMTMFLTTHYMEEAKNADFITIINKGSIIEEGTPAYLKSKYTKDILRLYNPNAKTEKLLKTRGLDYRLDNDVAVVDAEGIDFVLDLVGSVRNDISAFELVKGSIDDAFIKLVDDVTNTEEKAYVL